MSYVGKILVVVQVVMSLLFMAFAGAVYTTHANWRKKFDDSQKQLASAQSQARDAKAELETARTNMKTDTDNLTQEKNNALALNTTLTSEVDRRQARNVELEKERDAQSGIAVAKADESNFRKAEADRLRVANQQMQVTIDQQAADFRKKADEQFALENRFQQLNRQHEALLEQSAFFRELLSRNKIDPASEAALANPIPAPAVDGIVTDVQTNRSNRVSRVSISIGSDDGLKVGDTLSAYRTANVKSAEWLGTIKVVSLTPDTAVADVVLTSKSGIIQELDNVTTKF